MASSTRKAQCVNKAVAAALMTVLSLSIICSLVEGAASSTVRFNLNTFLQSHQIAASEVSAVTSAVRVPDKAPQWSDGFMGDRLRSGYFAIRPVGSTQSTIGHQLELTYSGGVNHLAVKQCSPMKGCTESLPTKALAGGTKVLFSSDGNDWEARLYGNICGEGSACKILVPSWTLDRIRSSGDGSMQSVPEVMTIVQYKAGLSLINAHSGSEWFRLDWPESGALAELGLLGGSRYISEGILLLSFVHGSVVLDFMRDRAFLIDGKGLSVFDEGIGNLTKTTATQIIQRSQNVTQAPLLVTDKVIVWTDAYFAWKVDGEFTSASTAAQLRLFVEKLESASESTAGIFGLSSNSETVSRGLWVFSATAGEFVPTRQVIAPSSPIVGSQVTLSADAPLQVSTQGVFELKVTGEIGNTSLSLTNLRISLLSPGGAFVVDDQKKIWRHYWMIPEENGRFRESGLSGSNGDLLNCSADEGVVTVTTLIGTVITVNILR